MCWISHSAARRLTKETVLLQKINELGLMWKLEFAGKQVLHITLLFDSNIGTAVASLLYTVMVTLYGTKY